jgi:SWI/SNF-related matrix-associated actin-dependent regulator of chromatin subfamily B protein 1
MSQGLDGNVVPNMGPNMAASMPGVPRQSSQPPVHPHQQSPARQLPPAHRSPLPAARKTGEIPGPAGAPPSNATPIPGATPGQKLPPHLASLNPAVTKISYIPYVVPPKPTETTDGASEEDKKPSPDASATEANDDTTEDKPASVKIEDPVPLLTPSEISALKDLMAHDAAYETVYRAKQARMVQELRTAGPGSRLAWWDRDYAASMGVNRRPERFDVRYPRPPRSEGSMGSRKKGGRREGIRM